MRGLSPVATSGGPLFIVVRCAGLSQSRPLSLRSTGSRCAGSVVVAHGLSRSAARGIFPNQGSNPCSLHWQADSQPLRHQGSPIYVSCSFLYWVVCSLLTDFCYLHIFDMTILNMIPLVCNLPFSLSKSDF